MHISLLKGVGCTFRDPADNAIVIYENKRPFVMAEFKGMRNKETPHLSRRGGDEFVSHHLTPSLSLSPSPSTLRALDAK
jgi:hypothetical protein